MFRSRRDNPRGVACRAMRLTWRLLAGAVVLHATPVAATTNLLEALGGADTVVLARAGPTERIDRHGRAAKLTVERTLVSRPAGSPGLAASGELRIAWEEPAPGAPPRLPGGARVLLGLEPFPGQTIWRRRFPSERPPIIARRGAARLIEPSAEAVAAIGAFLATPPAARREPGAVGVLAPLVAVPERSVALAALEWLGTVPGLAAMPEGSRAVLERVLLDRERPLAVRRGLLGLAGQRRITGLRGAVETLTATPGPVEGDAWRALASWEDGLPPARVDALLARGDPRVRAVAAERLRGPKAAPRLRTLAREDPAPEVRLSALTALQRTEGNDAAGELVAALTDSGQGVAAQALVLLRELGPAGLPALRESIDSGEPERTRAAIVALPTAGPEGHALLAKIARSHPDPKLRRIAEFALGRLETHRH